MCELPDGKSGSATALTIWRGPRSRDAVTLRRIQPSRLDAEPEESREWGIFTKHHAIDRFLGRRYSRGQSKEAFKFPIRSGCLSTTSPAFERNTPFHEKCVTRHI